MKMKRIRIFSDFCSSEHCAQVMETQQPYGVSDCTWTAEDDYTHAIILNTCMPSLKITKENVLGLAFEPMEYLNLTIPFIHYAQQHIGRYFIGDATHLPHPFESHYSYLWHIAPPIERPIKTKCMSIIVSHNRSAWGNRYRHHLANAILKTDWPIDIWGNGCQLLTPPRENDSRICGKFADKEPYEHYRFSVCIENFTSGHYISEKFVNPIVYECTPIYWGSKHAEHYFPGAFHRLSGDIHLDMTLLYDVLRGAYPAKQGTPLCIPL
jgi:hypothetical protein